MRSTTCGFKFVRLAIEMCFRRKRYILSEIERKKERILFISLLCVLVFLSHIRVGWIITILQERWKCAIWFVLIWFFFLINFAYIGAHSWLRYPEIYLPNKLTKFSILLSIHLMLHEILYISISSNNIDMHDACITFIRCNAQIENTFTKFLHTVS